MPFEPTLPALLQLLFNILPILLALLIIDLTPVVFLLLFVLLLFGPVIFRLHLAFESMPILAL